MRGELSILSELQRGVNVKGRRFRKMTKKCQLTNKNILEVKEMIKQKMQLKSQRMRRYDKRSKFYRKNMILKTDAKKFYREVGKEKILIRQAPPIENVEKYWKTVWSSDKKFNDIAEWVETIEQNNAHIEEQQWTDVTTGEVEKALNKSHKWKSVGMEKITNLWLHSLPCTHDLLANLLSEIMRNSEKTPDWLPEGLTYFIPKSKETSNPKDYEPITF